MDLFTMNLESNVEKNAPLADRLRPKSLEEFVGQDHLVGKGKFLTRSIKADRVTSMIFYGPPGTGKTSLAEIIANSTRMIFKKLSAVTAGVKDIRKVVSDAEDNLKLYSKKTILFIDEIHRFNKSQQDALLPYVEKGIIILIGATTENPYFEINKALLSRVIILELKPLGSDDLKKLIYRAINDEKGLKSFNVSLEKKALNYLLNIAEGDARTILNSLEIATLSTDKDKKGNIILELEDLKNSLQVKTVSYDKSGDEHYNTISAFIKSMRGSDSDATLYWLAKMIHAGEDPKFIARRIIIAASEDVGNADPMALQLAVSAFNAVNIVGMPEARIILSQVALYIANAPKSNEAYKSIDRALEDIKSEKIGRVPDHLKDSHYSGAKNLGHGIAYKNPHDYNSKIDQSYLPDSHKNKKYYRGE